MIFKSLCNFLIFVVHDDIKQSDANNDTPSESSGDNISVNGIIFSYPLIIKDLDNRQSKRKDHDDEYSKHESQEQNEANIEDKPKDEIEFEGTKICY